jgi:hypothetical protein
LMKRVKEKFIQSGWLLKNRRGRNHVRYYLRFDGLILTLGGNHLFRVSLDSPTGWFWDADWKIWSDLSDHSDAKAGVGDPPTFRYVWASPVRKWVRDLVQGKFDGIVESFREWKVIWNLQ